MKIISRVTQENEDLQRLREILEAATNGVIAEGGDFEPADNLNGLVTQVDIACGLLLEIVNILDKQVSTQELELARQDVIFSILERKFSIIQLAIQEGIEYDEDLDHATIDMMEAIIASGASEPTFDGELAFRENIVISKDDFKPIVRQAIESWLRLKASK